MSLDETCLSNGEVYTILTNKDAHGGKGEAGTFEKSDGLKGAAYGKSKGACYYRQQIGRAHV